MLIELLGIVASVLIVISLIFDNQKNLRKLNLIGSIFFAIYGFLIHSVSVAILNALAVIINGYKLYIRKEKVE